MTHSYEYDAFGNSFTISGSTPNNYLYRGEQYDPDLGLYYLRARYYNPLTGRLMSRDPEDGSLTDPASLHKYLYADADPVDGIDPTGREELVTYVRKVKKVLLSAPSLVISGASSSACFAGVAADLLFDINLTPNRDDLKTYEAECTGVFVYGLLQAAAGLF